MPRGDVWSGMRTDWLGRQHINKCRARMREFAKKEGQLSMMAALDTPQTPLQQVNTLAKPALDKARRKRA